jgi:OOP family OmpA-OmpF porin
VDFHRAAKVVSAFLKIGVLTGIGAFPFLCLDCVKRAAPIIQYELQNNVTSAITKDDQLRGVTVGGEGRQIVLTGTVSLESVRRTATRTAENVTGTASVDNRLAVSGGAPELQLRVSMMLQQRSIQFEPGKSDLADPSQAVLEDLRTALAEAPTVNLQVEGYTDNSGKEEKNRAISQKRAQAVVTWLAEHGIPRGRMQAVGFGPDNPIVSNATPEGRARNRRIEVKLSER